MKKIIGTEKGFTLIELVTVIGIMGILAAVVFPFVGGFIGSGETEAEDTELDTMQLAVTAMMADAGTNDLSGFENDVDELAEIEDIKAKSAEGKEYSLDMYLSFTGFPLSQAYDISKDGTVTVN